MFAWQPEEFIQETLRKIFPETEEGLQEKEQVEEQLKKIREQGYCISISEQDKGVASVAVPILNDKGHAVYSLAVIGEENRMQQKGLDAIRQELVRVARSLGRERHYIGG